MSTTIAKSVGNSNPLIDHHLGADPFALTYNGRVYIYMSSDNYEYNPDGSIRENGFNNLKSVFVISSEILPLLCQWRSWNRRIDSGQPHRTVA